MLQKFGSSTSDLNPARDSILLKFDPLLAKPLPYPVPTTTVSRLSATAEEDENLSEVNETSGEKLLVEQEKSLTQNSKVDPISQISFSDHENDSNINMEIMKDIVSENEKLNSNNLECEETKFK